MARTKLHGPLDGLLKAWYDTNAAELTIRYGEDVVTLDEDDCDRLLRVCECAPSDEQAENDLAEFFEGEAPRFVACRMATWFVTNQRQLDNLVYDHDPKTNYGAW